MSHAQSTYRNRRQAAAVIAPSRRARGKRQARAEEPFQEYYEDGDCPSFARGMLRTASFDVVIGIVIALNAVSIGVEQSLEVAGRDTTIIQIVESIFLVIYILELTARFVGLGASCLRDNWVKFDCFLVFFGVLSTWIVEPLARTTPGALGPLLVLRVLRLLRLAKTARLFAQIQEFWKLIRGFLNSVGIMCYTLVLVFLIIYVFTSLGVEIITKHTMASGADRDEAFADHVEKYFSNIPSTMITLMQFVTLDNMSHVYRPLVEKDPWLAFYFILLILVVSVLLMNLVAAVIFSSILEQEEEEHAEFQEEEEHAEFQEGQEMEWASMIEAMKELFLKNDKDKSGQLSRQEVLAMDEVDQQKLSEALGVSTPIEVFNALDVDRSGEVSINEFFDGIWSELLSNGSVDLKRLEKQIETMHWRTKETFGLQHDMRMAMTKVVQRLDSVLEETADMRSLAGSLITTLTAAQKGVFMRKSEGDTSAPLTPKRLRSIKHLMKALDPIDRTTQIPPRSLVSSHIAMAEKSSSLAAEESIGETGANDAKLELQPIILQRDTAKERMSRPDWNREDMRGDESMLELQAVESQPSFANGLKHI